MQKCAASLILLLQDQFCENLLLMIRKHRLFIASAFSRKVDKRFLFLKSFIKLFKMDVEILICWWERERTYFYKALIHDTKISAFFVRFRMAILYNFLASL